MMNKTYTQYINNINLFLKFIVLLLLVTKLADINSLNSLFDDIAKAKDFFFSSHNDDLQELILEEEDFPEVKIESPSSIENTPSSNLEPQNNKYLYTILKISGAIVCSGALLFGIYYGVKCLGNNVADIADVATKGLDESAKAIKKANDISLEILDKNKEILESQKTKLIKEIPKIKPREFYIPPDNDQ